MSKITGIERLFYNCDNFNQDIGGWDVASVTDMHGMFSGCDNFNQDLSAWDVSSVREMGYMFSSCEALNQSFENWDVSSVQSMFIMFQGTNLSIENYDKTLIGLASQNLRQDVRLGALGLEYCEGAEARDILINDFGWEITGDDLNCVTSTFDLTNLSVTIYPNPVSQNLHIVSEQTGIEQIQIYSTDGRLLDQHKFAIAQYTANIDVTKLPIGVYVLQVLLENDERYSERIVVVK